LAVSLEEPKLLAVAMVHSVSWVVSPLGQAPGLEVQLMVPSMSQEP
jgi:hypothetical protein